MVKLALEHDQELKENVRIVYDQSRESELQRLGGILEGGDHLVCDEETLACGVSDFSDPCFLAYMRKIFELDVERRLRYVCAVMMTAAGTRLANPHLDSTFNWVDEGRALVQPYWHESEIVDALPKKRLLIKLMDGYRDRLSRISPETVFDTLSLPVTCARIRFNFFYRVFES